MKKNKGVALYQYAIIIVLIILAVIPIFMLFGQNIVQAFTDYSKAFIGINSEIKNNIATENTTSNPTLANPKIDVTNHQSLSGGCLGGTADNPIRQCQGNECAIDFGEYILYGIPEDYNDFIESSGNSGGTDVMINLLEQMVTQLEANGSMNQTDLDRIKKLIAQGKDIIQVEQWYDERFNQNTKPNLLAFLQAKDALEQKYKNGEITTQEKNTQYWQLYKDYGVNNLNGNAYKNFDSGVETIVNTNLITDYVNPYGIVKVKANNEFGGTTSIGTGNKPASYEEFISSTNYPPDLTVPSYYQSDGVERYDLSPVGQYLVEARDVLSFDYPIPAVKNLVNVLSNEIYDISQKVNNDYVEFRGFSVNNGGAPENLDWFDVPANETTRLDLAIICNSHRGAYNPDNDTCNKYNQGN